MNHECQQRFTWTNPVHYYMVAAMQCSGWHIGGAVAQQPVGIFAMCGAEGADFVPSEMPSRPIWGYSWLQSSIRLTGSPPDGPNPDSVQDSLPMRRSWLEGVAVWWVAKSRYLSCVSRH